MVGGQRFRFSWGRARAAVVQPRAARARERPRCGRERADEEQYRCEADHQPPAGVRRLCELRAKADAGAGADDRAHQRDTDGRADLAAGRGDRAGHPGLRGRHAGDRGVGDRGVDEAEADAEDHVRGEQQPDRGVRRDTRQEQRADPERHPGDQQRSARADPRHEPAGDRGEHHRADRQWQRAQAGLQRREPTCVLQVERVQEQEGPVGAERADGTDSGAAERRAAEETDIDQRLSAAQLPWDEHGEREGRDRKQREDRRRGPTVGLALDDRVGERREPQDHQQLAHGIEAPRVLGP